MASEAEKEAIVQTLDAMRVKAKADDEALELATQAVSRFHSDPEFHALTVRALQVGAQLQGMFGPTTPEKWASLAVTVAVYLAQQ